MAISVTDRERPFAMAQVRGRVVERLDGDSASEVIDRLAEKYTGGPYPLREDRVALRLDRVVFLVEPDRASAVSYG